MTHAERERAERDFASAMLVEPYYATVRSVYADWLESEVGEVERAAMVRESEEFDDTFWEPTLFWWEFRSEGVLVFEILPFSRRHKDGSIARVHHFMTPHEEDRYITYRVLADGTCSDSPHNWAWLLSLALARGLVIPGLTHASG